MGLSRIALLALLLAPSAAAARADPRDARAEARALFERDTTAVQAGQFAEARADLERSLALVAHPSTAFNLVVALRGVGEGAAAEGVCAESPEPHLPPLDAERRREAERVCADVRASVAHLTIRAGGETPFELRLDGHTVAELAPTELLERALDPGEHVLSVVSPNGPPQDHALSLPPGARIRLELAAPAPARPAPIDIPLIAGLTTAGVVVLAAAIVTAALVATQSGPGADYPVVATLTSFD